MLRSEFQVVVLAGGKGSRMPEILAGRPKCLLPIANKPLIYYPLQMLEKAKYTEIILIVIEAQKSEIQKAIEKTDLKIKIDYVVIPNTEDMGTADSLRYAYDKITQDVIIISCDFITDLNLSGLINLYRKHDASIVSLLFNSSHDDTVLVPGPKSKHRPERDLFGVDNTTNRLVFIASSSDFDDVVNLSKRLLFKHNDITIYSNLLDSHCYIMKHWVIEYISNEKFGTLKGEVLPHIVKKQFSKSPKTTDQDKNLSLINVEVRNDIFQYAKEKELDARVKATSSYNDHCNDMKPVYHGDIIKCYILQAESSSFGIRVNTLPSYCIANYKMLEHWDNITSGKQLVRIHPNADVKTKQVDEKTLVNEGTKLSEKTSIKNSFIGSNCIVENKVKIMNCVIMNGVKINELCSLTNCIICEGAVIETGVELNDCLVGSHHTIPENSKHIKEILTVADRLMEI